MKKEVRKRRQLNPADFTRYEQNVHNQQVYRPIRMNRFNSPTDFTMRIEMAIRGGKKNRAVGVDRLHVEMFQVASATCTRILAA